jgi:hypothetical protein
VTQPDTLRKAGVQAIQEDHLDLSGGQRLPGHRTWGQAACLGRQLWETQALEVMTGDTTLGMRRASLHRKGWSKRSVSGESRQCRLEKYSRAEGDFKTVSLQAHFRYSLDLGAQLLQQRKTRSLKSFPDLKSWTSIYHLIQQYYSWGYTQKTVTPEAPAHPCLLRHYSQ